MCSYFLSLFPQQTAQSFSYQAHQVARRDGNSIRLCSSSNPSDTTGLRRDLFQTTHRLHSFYRFRSDENLRSPFAYADALTEELMSARWGHSVLLLVNLQFQLFIQTVSDGFLHPFTGSFTSGVGIAVVCVTDMLQTSLFKLAIQFIQQYIRQRLPCVSLLSAS